MQKLIEKNQKTTILHDLNSLNNSNAELYAMLKKLSQSEQTMSQPLSQRLQSMRTDIKQKIKQLSNNIDLLYQVFDRKIGLVIKRMWMVGSNSEDQLNQSVNKIQELQYQIEDMQTQIKSMKSQNEYLKNKNACLIDQLQNLGRKKEVYTNDSSRDIHHKLSLTQDYENSISSHLSPFSQPKNLRSHNDLTFNKPGNMNNKKKSKSEQDSFSSMILKNQKFEESFRNINSNENRSLGFGCMPSQNRNPSTSFQNRKLPQIYENQDQNHRLNYLLTNLKDNNEDVGSIKQSVGNYDSFERSGVKKYQI